MREQKLLVQGWRGISHSIAMVNQYQMLAWLKVPGLQLQHRDMVTFWPNWNSREMSAGFAADDAARLQAIPSPDGGEVDAVYTITFPSPVPTSDSVQARHITFMVSEYGLRPRCIEGPLAELQAFVRDGNAIVTPSAWSRLRVIEFGLPAEHVHVVSHGVQRLTYAPYQTDERQARRQALGFEDGDFVFANVGLASWNKGIDHLLTAFARVHQRHPQARLLIKNHQTMYGALVESILDVVAQAHPGLLSDAVMAAVFVVNSNLEQDALRELYACADCYVSPYRAEGFNLPVLEAMACGTPAVVTAGGATDDFCMGPWATRVPGRACATPESIMVGGHCIEIDPDALVEAMTARLLAPADAQRLGGAAWNGMLDALSWERVAQQALDICLPARA